MVVGAKFTMGDEDFLDTVCTVVYKPLTITLLLWVYCIGVKGPPYGPMMKSYGFNILVRPIVDL